MCALSTRAAIPRIQTASARKRPSKTRKNMHFGRKSIWLLGVAICLALSSSFARAHEGLPEQIAAITKRIKRDPKNASLYLQRGELYRLHRNWTRAAADYDRAKRLRPDLKIVDLVRGKRPRPFRARKLIFHGRITPVMKLVSRSNVAKTPIAQTMWRSLR